MQIVAGDALGNIHLADFSSKKIHRSDIEAGVEKSIGCMSWTGPTNDLDSELSIGRKDGIVQAYKLNPTMELCKKEIRLPSSIVYISYLNPRQDIINTLHTHSTLSDITSINQVGQDLLNISRLHYTTSFSLSEPHFEESSYTSLRDKLICIAETGHTCVIPWGDDYSPLSFESLNYKPILNTLDRRVRRKINISNEKATVSHSMGFYKLPGPVTCASTHPWLPNFIAFGGVENDVKIFDCLGENLIWTARNGARSNLDLRQPVNVTAIQWLPKINLNVFAAASKTGKVRIYDLRVQRRPVNEIEVTQEKRPITSMCTHTEMCKYILNQNQSSESGKLESKQSILAKKSTSSKSDWPLYISDTYGMIYKISLSKLDSPTDQHTSQPENFKLSLNGNFKGQMGSSTELSCSSDGKWLLSVGLGRHAHVFNTQTRKLNAKIYLKHKLKSCLFRPISTIKKKKTSKIANKRKSKLKS